jgi:hypothetical protein
MYVCISQYVIVVKKKITGLPTARRINQRIQTDGDGAAGIPVDWIEKLAIVSPRKT